MMEMNIFTAESHVKVMTIWPVKMEEELKCVNSAFSYKLGNIVVTMPPSIGENSIYKSISNKVAPDNNNYDRKDH